MQTLTVRCRQTPPLNEFVAFSFSGWEQCSVHRSGSRTQGHCSVALRACELLQSPVTGTMLTPTYFSDVSVWFGSIRSLTCVFSLGDSSTRQKNVSQSNTEEHVWLEAPSPRQTLLLLLVHSERCLACSWMLNWNSSIFLWAQSPRA